MTKKDTLAICAERMYIIEQKTIAEISNMLKVHEKSIRNWKTEGNWDKKRKQYLDSQQMFHEELFNFAKKLMISIELDMDNQEKIDPGRMYAFTKLLPLIGKIKEYEDKIAEKEKSGEEKNVITPDFIKEINERFLGIKLDE